MSESNQDKLEGNNIQGIYRRKMIRTVIAASLASSIAGGGIVAGLGMYYLPKTEMMKNSVVNQPVSEYIQNNDVKTSYSLTGVGELSIPQIAKKVGPAVVGISTSSTPYRGNDLSLYNGVQEGMGSGIVFNQEGYIVTNFHVVQGAQQINVIFSNGKEAKAKLINYDEAMDIAVIKLTDKVEISATAEFGDSDKIEVGEQAIAIGNPLGRDLLGSVTAGVVSAVDRQIDMGSKGLKLIQTDAAINPGNSGGALVNSKGQIIGINTAKIGGNGVEGIGFAIPINIVKVKIEELSKPLIKLGITGTDITEDMAKKYKLSVGVYIHQVQGFSAAERAGIKPGDIITSFAGEKIKSINDINRIKAKYKEGDVVKVEVVRDGKNKTLSLTLSGE
jgi:serine protease Do